MKRNSLFALLTAAGLCFSAAAVATDQSGIAVYATQKELKSRSLGGLNNFGKTFEITLENLSPKDIDLQMYCLKGYSHEGKEFPVDRIDDRLANGKLKPQGKVTGPVIFSAADDSVYQIVQVKISNQCH